MVTPEKCFAKYGPPEKESSLVVWDVPSHLEIGVIPKKLYCNKDLIQPLTKAFCELIATGFIKELKTFDGCFNIRYMRGSKTQASLHSWAIAIDVNAAWNGLGKVPVLSAGFVKCFTDNGFDWGGNWKRKDGMHFQLKEI
jgi:hypothetical protein